MVVVILVRVVRGYVAMRRSLRRLLTDLSAADAAVSGSATLGQVGVPQPAGGFERTAPPTTTAAATAAVAVVDGLTALEAELADLTHEAQGLGGDEVGAPTVTGTAPPPSTPPSPTECHRSPLMAAADGPHAAELGNQRTPPTVARRTGLDVQQWSVSGDETFATIFTQTAVRERPHGHLRSNDEDEGAEDGVATPSSVAPRAALKQLEGSQHNASTNRVGATAHASASTAHHSVAAPPVALRMPCGAAKGPAAKAADYMSHDEVAVALLAKFAHAS